MTLKLIKILIFLRGKVLHIFLCLVLIFAFCFKDSVPSAQAAGSEDYDNNSEASDTAEYTEAVTVFTEPEPVLSADSEAVTEETKVQEEAETETVTEAATFEEETTAEETTAEETTTEETTTEEETEPETTAEETEPEPETEAPYTEPPAESTFPLNSAYGQRYQEQWEIDYANQLFDLVNAERAKYSLEPFKKLDALTTAATERAWEVSRYNSHTRPDGTSCFTVLTQYGLSLNKRAENIAYFSKTPGAAFNSLMGNSSHRAPILSSRFEYMGVGFYCVYDDASGYHYYWTQIFYTP